MRLLALIVAALVLGACGAKTTPPSASTTTPTTTTPSAAAALDCAKPANAAQQVVCGDPHLTDLDHRLQASYQQAVARPGADQAALTAGQDRWATARDGCAQNPEMRTCLVEAYQTRLVQLAIADPATVTPPVVTYRCPADAGPLTAQFYNQFDPPTAVLNWKGNQQILFLEPSGSGARYGRQGSEYWEHQGEVKLELNGTKFVCRAP
ncbi:lipoprotein LprI [Mycobacterium nebraskense]|uniref:lysozyme inhibitor LprI family protein n=1 Tax=Mycobacterium nebraskense TaxID=244292 RepID=UPI00064244C8|nr:lysozyme inhibitor LprI family protein [Mycobacterium nebraskense]KLO41450.1 lipoprotein LprI [Mycobacterium nebraskense]